MKKKHIYESVSVGDVVGELEAVEGDHPGHPVAPRGRAVRVDVEAARRPGVGSTRHHPAAVLELVPAVVCRHHVHQQDVVGLRVQAGAGDPEWGEHAPGVGGAGGVGWGVIRGENLLLEVQSIDSAPSLK